MALTLDLLKKKGYSLSNPQPAKHALNVTVPGAAAGWVDTVERFGSKKVRTYICMNQTCLLGTCNAIDIIW